jgi:hypothetical protein
LEKGFKNLTSKHGKICGLWLGPQRAVVVSDFEVLQEMLNKPETSDRQIWAVAGNYHHNFFNTAQVNLFQQPSFLDNPQYDKRFFIEFQEKYKLTTCCVQIRPGNRATLGLLRTYLYYCRIVGLIPVIPYPPKNNRWQFCNILQ